MGEPRPRTWPVVLGALMRREDLAADDTAWAMGEMMAGEATPVQLAAFAAQVRLARELDKALVVHCRGDAWDDVLATLHAEGAPDRVVRKVSTTRRQCSVCGERLSAYNPGPNCFVHSTSASRRPEAWKTR